MKKILITGGTGSLGRALVARLETDASITGICVFSRDEGKHALYYGQNNRVFNYIGDVRDKESIRKAFRRFKPTHVIHAAALKRIDDMEHYPDECIKTNILGTQNVADVCAEFEVERCILISTDKACMPINVYGASKFTAERLMTHMNYITDKTVFSSVRYGNVIASRGSFIPLWIKKMKNGERLPITDYNCTRYLFKLSSAVNTVLTAMDIAQGGEVFVPHMRSYSIETVLEAIACITDVKIDSYLIGLRPGEKIHEDMLSENELVHSIIILPVLEKDIALYAILPQYYDHVWSDKKVPSFKLNSSLDVEEDYLELKQIIEEGIQEGIEK